MNLSKDKELIQNLIAGEAPAFRKIYEIYQSEIFRFAFYLTKSSDLAEDVVQSVFINLWEKRNILETNFELLPYMKRMTQNLVIDIYRKANRDKKLQKQIFENMVAINKETPAKVIEEKQLRQLFIEAIEKLPPQKKIIFTLRRDMELSYIQIAEKLNLSPNTVRNHLAEARNSIKDYIISNSDIAFNILFIFLLQNDLV